MKTATIQLETLTCPSCLQKIENAVKGLNGVDKNSVQVLFNSSKVKVSFNDDLIGLGDIEKAVTALGYEVKNSSVK